ncbi:MAG: hypothetical protein SGI74_14800 [Oligoflexia bacterium]|nr:hypothetical protein [Oligoflexia bacterium]
MPQALILWTLLLFCFNSTAQGQNSGGGQTRPTGALSAGVAQFNVLSPGDIRMNNGQFFSLSGEKGFGFWRLYIEALFDYYKTTGTLNYNYQSPTGVTYTANQVNYGFEKFLGGVGIRWKIIQRAPFRPYIEAGVGAGYVQISYDQTLRTSALTALGRDFKTFDTVLDFTHYGEAGFEFGLIKSFGIKVAARYMDCSMRILETLRKQSPRYTTLIYYGGIFASF